MSYILDALRKSDQQRRVGQVPTLTPTPVAAAAAEGNALVFYATSGVILLVAIGMVMAWIGPMSQAPAPVSAASVAAGANSITPLAPPARLATAAPLPATPAKTEPEAETPRSEAPSTAAPAQGRRPPGAGSAETRRTPPTADAMNRRSLAADGKARSGNAVVRGGASDNAVKGFPDMPQSIRRTIPVMAVAVHAYSDKPVDRLVSINGRVLREGESLAPDLRLEQITPDGMIFTYRGYRFRRGAR